MKRKVASRRLLKDCDICGIGFKKGNVYYTKRYVVVDYDYRSDKDYVCGYEVRKCARCFYEENEREARFEEFKKVCEHKSVEEVWSFIPGEAVMEPDYDRCRYCGKIV